MAMANMAATLSYVDHHPNPNTICTICLEPVAQQALKISCHLPLNCAECMNYWMEHQIGYRSRTSCPRCRSFVDSSNLTAPRGSIEWKDVDEMDWNGEEEYESYSSDEENGSSASDELAAIRPKDEDTTGETIPDEEEGIFMMEIDDGVTDKVTNKENIPKQTKDEESATEQSTFSEAHRRKTRQKNILAATLTANEVQQLYFQHDGDIPFPFAPHNTYFGPNVVHNSSILIRGEYQYNSSKDPEHYFFWVHEATNIGDLIAMWIGGHCQDHELEAESWVFEGKVLQWADTVLSCGMKDGSRFQIRRSEDN